jgi:hypothetical protein
MDNLNKILNSFIPVGGDDSKDKVQGVSFIVTSKDGSKPSKAPI